MSYAAPYQFAQPFAVYPQTGYAMNNFGAGANPYGYAYANTPYYGYGGSPPTQVVPYTIASNGMPYYSPYYIPYTRNPHRAFGGLRSAFARKIFGPKPWRRVHWAPGRQYRHDGGRFGAAWGNIYGARPGTPMPNAVYPQIALPGNYQVPYGGYGSFPVTNVITIPSAYSNVSEEVHDDDDSDGSSEYSDEY